jgi:hypothetical protein
MLLNREEIDLTYSFVRGLQLVGLAWDVSPVKVATYLKEQKGLNGGPKVDDCVLESK